MPRPRVAIATSACGLEWDVDLTPLLGALAAIGIDGRAARWDNPDESWDDDLVVIRSTWDYVDRLEEFLGWVEGVPHLANPADIIAWNTDKRYLCDLATVGVPVVPTSWVEVGAPAAFPAVEFVVKPVVGNGARDAGRFAPGEDELAQALIDRLHATGRVAMIQPYLPLVDALGEVGVIVLGGEVSHSIRKGARLVHAGGRPTPLAGDEGIVATVASDDELRVAAQVLEAVPGGGQRLLYARVDLAPGPDGSPLLMELEATEPALFLHHRDGSAERLARAIGGRLATG
jgi:glutathione synthase/RimK-type ligase-like ATP-grasp enzyme